MKFRCIKLLSSVFLFSLLSFAKDITITIPYNNVSYRKDLTTAWGISIFIEGLEKSILFDTGGEGSILLSNMKALKIDPKDIDIVVLSHIHSDHVGGLSAVLEKNNNISVYFPSSFPNDFKKRTKKVAKKVIPVKKSIKICKDVFSTGELGTLIKEQSLIINTKKGLIVLTGCAHPGIVNIVKFAKRYLKKDVYLVIGGFHLIAYSESQVKKVIEDLKELGVKKVGSSHCTGGKPMQLFKKAWGKDFIELGCGAKISFLKI